MKITLSQFKAAHVLVVGDVMLDRYWHGITERISPEAPVPVVHVTEQDERPGGAGNVALNLAALGAGVSLIGRVGDDAAGQILQSKLEGAGIDCQFRHEPKKPTITKLRVLSQHQQLIRMDFEESFSQSKEEHPLLPLIQREISKANIMIVSDYGKGSMGSVQTLIQAAKKTNIPILVDPKGSDFSIYKGATILTPNVKEFTHIVGPCSTDAELVTKARGLIRELDLKGLLITRGAKGMTLVYGGEPEAHLPAHAHEVYDVTGAGDTVIATLGAALGSGIELKAAVALANHAAGIVVGKLGAATVSVPELRLSISEGYVTMRGIMTEEQLLRTVEDAKAQGETIVFTNGCFDILHAGHVAYLEKAKALGSRLIVAVNEDESVKRLKGVTRPINTLAKRLAVLAGLSAVDWIVGFSEDTPHRLISQVLPHILVKGGDYKPEGIVGGDIVIAHGGIVKVLPYEDGCSTSQMISKIQEKVDA